MSQRKVAPFYRNGTKIHKLEALNFIEGQTCFFYLLYIFFNLCLLEVDVWVVRQEGGETGEQHDAEESFAST